MSYLLPIVNNTERIMGVRSINLPHISSYRISSRRRYDIVPNMSLRANLVVIERDLSITHIIIHDSDNTSRIKALNMERLHTYCRISDLSYFKSISADIENIYFKRVPILTYSLETMMRVRMRISDRPTFRTTCRVDLVKIVDAWRRKIDSNDGMIKDAAPVERSSKDHGIAIRTSNLRHRFELGCVDVSSELCRKEGAATQVENHQQ